MLIQIDSLVGDAKSLWTKEHRPEIYTCQCDAESGCGPDCHNRIMSEECNDSTCRVGGEKCTNRQFDKLQERLAEGKTNSAKKFGIGVDPVKTTDRGFGLRANRSFEPHQIIVEYTGEIITKNEANARTQVKKDDEVCAARHIIHCSMLTF